MATKRKYDTCGEASVQLRFYMSAERFTPEFWQTVRDECAEALDTISAAARSASGGIKTDEYYPRQTILFSPNGPDPDGVNDNYEEYDIVGNLEVKTRFYVDYCSCSSSFSMDVRSTLEKLCGSLGDTLNGFGVTDYDASPGPHFSLCSAWPAVYS